MGQTPYGDGVQHVPPRAGLKLPSLEWLQSINRQALIYSSCFIALGLIAGIILNAVESRGRAPELPWNDTVVVSSTMTDFPSFC